VRSPAGGLLAGVLRDQATWQLPPLGWGRPYIQPLLARAARDRVSVVLTGDGADELFGTRLGLLGDLLARGRVPRAVAMTRRLPGAGCSPRARDVVRILARQGLPRALPAAWQRVVRPGAAAPDWLLPTAARSFAETDDPWSWKRLDGPRWWCHVAELVTTKIDSLGFHDILRRDAAVAGLEGRAPFFDLELVELALAVPPEQSFDPHLGKPLLRKSMEGLVPDAVRLRREKARFDDWLVDSLEAERPALRELLGGPDARVLAFAHGPRLRDRLLEAGPDRHPEGRFGWARTTWRVLTAECWLRGEEDGSFAARLRDALAPAGPFFRLDAHPGPSYRDGTDHDSGRRMTA
jgi:asparagine synthase (glutamine-hydrolysing)